MGAKPIQPIYPSWIKLAIEEVWLPQGWGWQLPTTAASAPRRSRRVSPGLTEPHQVWVSPTREPEGLTTQEEADAPTLCRTLAAEHFQFRLVGIFARISQQEWSKLLQFYIHTIRLLKNFGFIDKSHFCFFQLTLLSSPKNHMLHSPQRNFSL